MAIIYMSNSHINFIEKLEKYQIYDGMLNRLFKRILLKLFVIEEARFNVFF